MLSIPPHGENGIIIGGSANRIVAIDALAWVLVEAKSGLAQEVLMVSVAILARIVAKPGKEEEVAAFLASALPLAENEPATTVWFAIRLSKSEFGIFDAFPDNAGRDAHLNGPIAAALMAKASELLAEPPQIRSVDVLAAKLSK